MSKEPQKESSYLILLRSPLGLTEAELEQETGIRRRTLNNYLRELEAEGKIYKDGRVWAALDYERLRLRKFDLSPEEAMTLYLAARLFVKQHDKRNDAAQSALLKLAEVLTADAGVGDEIRQAARELAHRPDDGSYNRIFRTVMQAYIFKRRLRIEYGPATRGPFITEFEPYLIEPSAIGFATYAIGRSSIVNDIRTYKLERIRSASLLVGQDKAYTIPADFPGLDILKSAWSIIHGEKVEPVRLRFSPNVRKRVLETRWHPSQDTADDSERPGYLLWSAQVADVTDMLYWIRGWGADVEVLEPKEVRQLIAQEAKTMAQLYNMMENKPMPSHMRLWAKADRETYRLHRLIYHMLDVGAVAQTLWDKALPGAFKTFVAEACGLSIAETGRLVAFWAALHDLGKASPIFQWHPRLSDGLRRVILTELRAAEITIPQWRSTTTTRHEIISTWALAQQGQGGLFTEMVGDTSWAYKIAALVGGHHGEFPKNGATAADQLLPEHRGDAEWDALRTQLFRELQRILLPPSPRFNGSLPQEQENRLLALLAAFVSIADWIGSDEEFFPYEEGTVELNGYAVRSAALARCAVAEVGWGQQLATLDEVDFERLFKRTPRPIQQVMIGAVTGLDAPALVILEAPTGIGKTEAALYLADCWCRDKQTQGLYMAMPTMATSNQMHERVTDYVQTRHGANVDTLLVHSQAELKPHEAKDEMCDAFEDNAKQQDRVTARTWFLPRKRSLLAPFGVGTVDQSLMSILQTKHFFVRLFGLYRKVVIFDEVHAYDTYMTELFKLLLKWLRALDASVIILSATLPDQTRRELVKAYAGHSNLPSTKYPRLTLARGDGDTQVIPLPQSEPRHLALAWVERDPAAIAARVKQELSAEGCAAVICNTVDRAQQVYDAILAANLDCAPEHIILFHARTPRIWRDAKEKSVLEKFGPPEKSKRPPKAIVVATQLIEQSLDLDFDVMISDLGPMDFLIQRAGRLQRHDRGPRLYRERLIVASSLKSNGMPEFEKDTYVYHRYTLLATYFALRHRAELVLPDDAPRLIEQVYGEEQIDALTDAERATLERAREDLERKDDKERLDAREKLVRPPEDDRFLYGANADLDEDDPSLHKAYRALTRNDDPGLSLICLHRTARGLALEPKDESPVFDEQAELSPEQVKEVLQGVVNVRKHIVVDHFLATELPRKWRKSHALRYHRLAIIENGVYDGMPELQLRLDEKLGLQYIDRKEAT